MSDLQLPLFRLPGELAFVAEDQAFFGERGWPPPKRCLACRRAAKARREASDVQQVRFDDGWPRAN